MADSIFNAGTSPEELLRRRLLQTLASGSPVATSAPGAVANTNILDRLTGYQPVAVPPEAAEELGAARAADISAPSNMERTLMLLKNLAVLGGIFSGLPGPFLLGTAFEGMRGEARGGKEGAVEQALSRRKQRRADQFQFQQEGLEPTPAGAVPGYMSVGEARGRTALAAEERASAAAEKAAAQHFARFKDTAEAILKRLAETGKITPSEQSALQLYGELLQSQNPFAAMMQVGVQQRMQDVFNRLPKGPTAGGPAPIPASGLTPAQQDAFKVLRSNPNNKDYSDEELKAAVRDRVK